MQHDSPYDGLQSVPDLGYVRPNEVIDDTLISRDVRRLVACRLDGRGVGR